MEKLKNYLLASMGLVILSMTLAFTGAGRAIAQRVDTEGCLRLCEPSSPIPVTARVPLPVAIGSDVVVMTRADSPLKVQAAGPALEDIISDQIVLTLEPGKQIAAHTLTLPHQIVVQGFTGTVTVEPANGLPFVGIQPMPGGPVLPLSVVFAGHVHGVSHYNVTFPYPLSLYPGGNVVLKRIGNPNATIRLTMPMFGS